MFLEAGMLHKWTADEMMGVLKSGLDTPAELLSDTWNDNPNTYKHMGQNMGSLAQSTVMTGVNFGFLVHSQRRFNGLKGKQFTPKGGTASFYAEPNAGKGFFKGHIGSNNSVNHGFVAAEGAEAVTGEALELMAKGGLGTLKGGVLKKGKFLGELGGGNMLKGLAPFVVPVVALGLARSALGVAGSVVDQALGDYRRSKQHFVDQRYFNTEEANQSSYNQIGIGMRAQSQVYLNTSRIFHSR